MANEKLDDPNIGLAKDKRRTVQVILGAHGAGEGPLLAAIQLGQSESLPDLLSYRERLYIKRDETRYAIATVFPLVGGVDRVRELDGASVAVE